MRHHRCNDRQQATNCRQGRSATFRTASLLFAIASFLAQASQAQSQWVHFGVNRRLVYNKTTKGDRIPDFSSAGYRGGGVALPAAIVRARVSPTGGADDTQMIQAALDKVAKLAPEADAERGAVELAAGTFHLAGTLRMHVSGVVLRGAGSMGANSTVLEMVGAPHLAIEMQGAFHEEDSGASTWLTDSYVPAGSMEIHAADASQIHAGDTIEIVKPVTAQWVHFMGMDHLRRNGKPEVWVHNDIRVRRRVAAVSGTSISLEVPLTDCFDSTLYPGLKADVTPVKVTGQISETGVENVRIVSPARSISYREDPEFDGIAMDNVVDSWLRSVRFEDTTNAVRIDQGAERLTLVGVEVHQRKAVTSSAKPFDFRINGSQILLDRCSGEGNKVWYVATQSRSEGPVVVLHCRFRGDGTIEGHQRWSTGLLVDGCSVPKGEINLRNRGEMGSGHGWAVGWSVLWNNRAASFLVQNPPGAMNWSIGDVGRHTSDPMPVFELPVGPILPSGVVESMGKHVNPPSLYLEQLRERLGSAAISAIGYR